MPPEEDAEGEVAHPERRLLEAEVQQDGRRRPVQRGQDPEQLQADLHRAGHHQRHRGGATSPGPDQQQEVQLGDQQQEVEVAGAPRPPAPRPHGVGGHVGAQDRDREEDRRPAHPGADGAPQAPAPEGPPSRLAATDVAEQQAAEDDEEGDRHLGGQRQAGVEEVGGPAPLRRPGGAVDDHDQEQGHRPDHVGLGQAVVGPGRTRRAPGWRRRSGTGGRRGGRGRGGGGQAAWSVREPRPSRGQSPGGLPSGGPGRHGPGGPGARSGGGARRRAERKGPAQAPGEPPTDILSNAPHPPAFRPRGGGAHPWRDRPRGPRPLRTLSRPP